MKKLIKYILLSGMIMLQISCGSQGAGLEDQPEPVAIATLSANENGGSGDRFSAAGITHQWAVSAEASSEFANPEWSADQALGEPDSPGCGDYQLAWASAASDSIDTLTLEYSDPVIPLEIEIHQSFNPDQIVKVEVFNAETGGFYTVLQKNPRRVDRPCPYELIIPIDGIKFQTNLIRITVDQSQLGLGWNEIDAVKLIGSIDQP
jgi:hypothetical protein